MTKTEQLEFDRMRYSFEAMVRKVESLQHEYVILSRVTEMLFEDHGIYDDARDEYYRRAKAE